jgi:hyperosmotically inducible protein
LHGLAGDIIEQHEPGAAADRSVRAHVVDALRHEPLLASRLINVTVHDGAVALWGPIENGAQRDAAEQAARAVSGVRSIENNLGPEPVSGLPI